MFVGVDSVLNFDSNYVKIDLDAIAENFAAVEKKTGVPVMAIIKADAYGHGAVQVARLLEALLSMLSACCLQVSL